MFFARTVTVRSADLNLGNPSFALRPVNDREMPKKLARSFSYAFPKKRLQSSHSKSLNNCLFPTNSEIKWASLRNLTRADAFLPQNRQTRSFLAMRVFLLDSKPNLISISSYRSEEHTSELQ